MEELRTDQKEPRLSEVVAETEAAEAESLSTGVDGTGAAPSASPEDKPPVTNEAVVAPRSERQAFSELRTSRIKEVTQTVRRARHVGAGACKAMVRMSL